MDRLLTKYSQSIIDLACARQGILKEQLIPLPPSLQKIKDPALKMEAAIKERVHNAAIYDLIHEVELELQLLQPTIEVRGPDRINLIVLPYKSVTDAKLVHSMTELPQVKVKAAEEAAAIPETLEVPRWLDQDGDGIISKSEYQVLEKEIARAKKFEILNQKNINVIIRLAREREEKEQKALRATEELIQRKKNVQASNKASRNRIVEKAQAKIKKQTLNKKLHQEQHLLYQKRHAKEMLQ